MTNFTNGVLVHIVTFVFKLTGVGYIAGVTIVLGWGALNVKFITRSGSPK